MPILGILGMLLEYMLDGIAGHPAHTNTHTFTYRQLRVTSPLAYFRRKPQPHSSRDSGAVRRQWYLLCHHATLIKLDIEHI